MADLVQIQTARQEDGRPIVEAIGKAILQINASNNPAFWYAYLLELVDGKYGEAALIEIRDLINDRLSHGGW